MKKSIWANADVYGQLGVWLLSILPFIFFFVSLFKSNEFYTLLLLHALGLLIVGLWQVVSTMINLLIAEKDDKKFFTLNLLIALVLGSMFFAWVYSGNFKIPLPATKIYYNYVLGIYFLVVNIAAIRYWKYIGRYYKQKNYV
ncbi:hypothetical protein [Sediminibacterium goheungense]|uniref:Uncharacterized protein n=1 Tax=Sediminibacterium goheungense TaxID=1086393 RepID=A0A4R6J0F2_9BACT|nr:hypothetical protein [Sediminibacterium goheungense]TDO28660.1 hypothetical protein BC659_0738 [Sediminibacterium goheungense]